MPYSTYTDVQSQMRRVEFTTTSVPTISDVTAYIVLVDADIDAKLSSVGLTVPVTDSAKLPIIKQISVNGTAAMICRSLQMEVEETDMRQKLYDNALKGIMANPAIIATSSGSGPKGSASTLSERVFIRDERQW